MSKTLEHLKTYKRKCLKGLYDQCTESQQALFNRGHKGVEKIPEDRINGAIQLLERTIAKNEEKINEPR